MNIWKGLTSISLSGSYGMKRGKEEIESECT